MQRYEAPYRKYFRVFCAAIRLPGGAMPDAQPNLLARLEHQPGLLRRRASLHE